MDAVFLARIQFAINVGFHYIFPPITLGLTCIIVIIEFLYYRTDSDIYKQTSMFLVKILGLVFAMGVATGIVLEFSFGTNWAQYSRMVGDIFGAPLAAEGIFSFFLESIFLGVLLFARDKVSKKAYLAAAILVFIASHLSGLWIIIANSWMQTPAGFKLAGDKIILIDFFKAAINHSTIQRYIHTIVAAWITGSLFIAGICSWFLLKKRDEHYARPLLKIALILFIASSLAQFITGHAHAVQVANTQPAKMATFEALWKTQNGAPMSLLGFPDEKNQKTHFEIAIPRLLSFFIHFDSNATITGLDKIPKNEHPPVLITYLSYHMMIMLGSFFALISLTSLFLMLKKQLYAKQWFLKIMLFSIPLPLLANEVGWMSAEIGRQPWAVYKILKTANAISVTVPAWKILFSLIMFSLIYLLLAIVFIKLLIKIINKGPAQTKLGY